MRHTLDPTYRILTSIAHIVILYFRDLFVKFTANCLEETRCGSLCIWTIEWKSNMRFTHQWLDKSKRQSRINCYYPWQISEISTVVQELRNYVATPGRWIYRAICPEAISTPRFLVLISISTWSVLHSFVLLLSPFVLHSIFVIIVTSLTNTNRLAMSNLAFYIR